MRTQLEKGEKLIVIARKHWIYVWGPVVGVVASFILTILVYHLPGFTNVAVYLLIVPLILGIYGLFAYLDREYNIWVVTNRRVIDEWGIFTRNSKETPLDRIQNITSEQSVLGRILGFGNLRIQTAATQGSVVYRMVEKPDKLKDVILKYQQILTESKITEQAEKLAKKMVDAMQQAKSTATRDKPV